MSDNLAVFDYFRAYSQSMMENADWYMNGIRSKDGYEKIKRTKDGAGWLNDIDMIVYFRPYFRSVTGKDHTMFVQDIDVKIPNEDSVEEYTDIEKREIMLQVVLNEFNQPKWVDDFGMYISGRGLYLIQRVDRPISPLQFENIIYGQETSLYELCDIKHKSPSLSCNGWHDVETDLVKVILYGVIEVHVKVDKRTIDTESRRLFRGVYSPYFKIKDQVFFCIPLEYMDNGMINISETIKTSQRHTLKDPKPFVVPKFTFDHLLSEYDDSLAHFKARKERIVRNTSIRSYKSIKIPKHSGELTATDKYRLNRIEFVVNNSDNFITPPCIRNSFEQKYKRSEHNSRVVLLRYLLNKGYSLRDIGLLFRFRINDVEDNRVGNLEKLEMYLNYYKSSNGQSNDLPPNCNKIQGDLDWFLCSESDKKKCGRRYMLNDKPVIKDKTALEKTDGFELYNRETNVVIPRDIKIQQQQMFEGMNDLCNDILNHPDKNLEVIKTTRAGVTTSLTYNVAKHGKKMLAVVPTNAIGEDTGRKAINIAYKTYDTEVETAILSSNLKSCLKLRFTLKDLEHKKELEESWGGDGVGYKKMAFHFKPSCVYQKDTGEYVECEYYHERFDFPRRSEEGIPLLVAESDIINYGEVNTGLCAYTTVINKLDNYDVIFITYDKLNSLLMNDSDDSHIIIDVLMNDFDVLFLDEISQFAQSSPLTINIFNKTSEDTMYDSFISEARRELDLLVVYATQTETFARLHTYVTKFLNFLEPIVDTHIEKMDVEEVSHFSNRYSNPLSDTQRIDYGENFGAYYTLLEDYVKAENFHLSYIEKIIILLSADVWWIQNIITHEMVSSLSIITSPKIENIRKFVRGFSEKPNHKVLVTDATMPLIKMSDLFGMDFTRFVVGDPRNTCDNQLIISDNKRLSTRAFLMNKSRYSKIWGDLIVFINTVYRTHKTEDDFKGLMIVAPNSGYIYKQLKNLQRERILPYKMDITYFRSDKTVGVSSEYRIMITICPPYPPTHAFDWLAQYYHEYGFMLDLSIREIGERLEKMNAFSTFYQTIGRSKSPDISTNSVVYTWGIGMVDLDVLLGKSDKDVPQPHLTFSSSNNGWKQTIPKMGKIWKMSKIKVDEGLINLINKITDNSIDVNRWTIKRLMKFYRRNSKQREILTNVLTNTSTKILEYLGIFISRTSNNVYVTYKQQGE